MDVMTLLLLIAIFLFTASIIQMLYLAWAGSRFAARRTLKKRLLYMSAGGYSGQEKLSLYKNKALKDAGVLERLAFSLPRIGRLDRMLVKSGFPLNVTGFLSISLILGVVGGFVGAWLFSGYLGGVALGMGCLFAPFLLLRHAEKKSLAKFDEQLPETLDLLGRSVRAGHALSSGFEIVAEEMAEPTRGEFAAAIDEINLGLSFREALENMCTRVPSRDLRFFAIAVMIQKESGGNIAEILDKISSLIRERIEFKRQVEALTAEGKLSAIILIMLPILIFFFLYFKSYQYVSLLWTDPLGHLMGGVAIVLMILGIFAMKKIVSIEL
jgi:tight adherence protein B